MKKYIQLFMFLGLATQLSSQEVWSLEECVKHSIENSIAIEQSKQGIAFAEIDYKQSKQERYPNLNGNINVNWNFGRSIDPTTNEFITTTFFSNNYGFNSNALLFNGFRIKNSIKQSEINLAAAESDTEQVERDIALQVAANFLNVLFAKENISLAEKQLVLSQQQLNQINKLIASGARPAAERLNLEAQIAQSEQMLIGSQNSLDIAYLNLKQVLRLDPDYQLEIEIPEDVPFSTDPDLITFNEAFKMALLNRPDLVASDLRIESAELGVDIAKAFNYPSISAGGSLGTVYSNQARSITGTNLETFEQDIVISSNDPTFPIQDVSATIASQQLSPIFENTGFSTQIDENISYGFGIGVSVPIYNRGSTKAGIQRAELNATTARLQKEQITETLKITVQQAIADARAAKKKKEASAKSLEAQKLAFENAEKRLKIGATNTFEWDSQKTQLENAETTNLIDKYDYLFKIKVLEFYLGKPLKF